MQTKRRLLFLFLTLFVAAVFATGSAQAQAYTERVLYSFQGGAGGAFPFAGLVRDAQGNLYGTTYGGGDPTCISGCGIVFKVDTTGKETVLHTFSSPDGQHPYAGLVQDAQGILYGTTGYGGASGSGTVFKVDTTGEETVLYSFTDRADGGFPVADLVLDAQGNLYGTTGYGGASGWGTVFKVDTTGKETVLYSFTIGADGSSPDAGLVRDAQGNLYGTTPTGGDLACLYGCGTVFKVDTTGKETVLYSFTGKQALGDGANPSADLVPDAQGNLYGTTSSRGAYLYGTVFKVDTTGKETVLYSFIGTEGDGANPVARLVQDTQGNLYGTTYGGGAHQHGTVFKLDTTGKETVLYSFTGGADGGSPESGLVLDAQGNLYGTTSGGGDLACDAPYGCGTVFELQMPSTLTVSTSGNGTVTSIDGFISCPGTCSHSYPPNTPVTLNATSGQGWVFGGWNGGCFGTGSCTVTMTQSLTVDAIFSQPLQLVTVPPCRLVDTRPDKGGMAAHSRRTNLSGASYERLMEFLQGLVIRQKLFVWSLQDLLKGAFPELGCGPLILLVQQTAR